MAFGQRVAALGKRVCNPLGREGGPTAGPLSKLRVALIADDLTRTSLAAECQVANVTPENYGILLRCWKPDFLLVESAWNGFAGSWRYRIAAYPDVPRRNNRKLAKVVAAARDRGIPTVFWNREDGVHFDRFVASAVLFDHIYTVDDTCVARYRARAATESNVGVLMFAVQPQIHRPNGEAPILNRAAFVGSYNSRIHPRRLERQQLLFAATRELGLTVYDRNSARRAGDYRFPSLPWLEVRPGVPYAQTAELYRRYSVQLNVNTVETSGTMFSRRLIEIMACGAVAVTTPALSVARLFGDYVQTVGSVEEASAYFHRVGRDGLSRMDRERARAGARHVLGEYRWDQRLQLLADSVC